MLPQSTMELEMITLVTASKEASWLLQKPIPDLLIHCDSTSTIAKIDNDPLSHTSKKRANINCSKREATLEYRIIRILE